MRLLDKHTPKYVPCLCSVLARNWQKWYLMWLLPALKLIFSESTGCISTIKISQDRFKFSKGDSEKYLGFIILCRRPGKSIMPGIVEGSGGKPLKSRLKTVFWFFKCLQKLIKIIIIRRKIGRCYPAVLLYLWCCSGGQQLFIHAKMF